MGEYNVRIPVLIAHCELEASIYIPNTAYESDGDACEIHIWLDDSDIQYLCDGKAFRDKVEHQFSCVAELMRESAYKIADLYGIALMDDSECFGITDGKLYFMFTGHWAHRK